MNMKSLIALTALTAAGAASAVVTSTNTLCRIKIDSGTQNTIVAVPLLKVGDGTAIPANELVLTDNLSNGDSLLHWNGTTWDAWEVENGVWTAKTVSDGNETTESAAPSTTLTRGDAVWVERDDATNPFYIYGQVTTAAATMPVITRAENAATYIMMGNTALEPVAISSLSLNGTLAKGDKISVPATTGLGVKEYTYDGGKWTKVSLTLGENGVLNATTTEVANTDAIPAGQGFWYVAKATGSNTNSSSQD